MPDQYCRPASLIFTRYHIDKEGDEERRLFHNKLSDYDVVCYWASQPITRQLIFISSKDSVPADMLLLALKQLAPEQLATKL